VRGIVYSYGTPLVSEWMYDEERARLFLLQYAGGGTDYPFPVLKASARDRADVVRVVISDSDFLANVKGPGAMDTLAYAVDRSRLVVAFLAVDPKWAGPVLAPVLSAPKFRLVPVGSLSDFGRAAADLARALFGPLPGAS
jgi:hypothetical protein